jgi:hypothetical protein
VEGLSLKSGRRRLSQATGNLKPRTASSSFHLQTSSFAPNAKCKPRTMNPER